MSPTNIWIEWWKLELATFNEIDKSCVPAVQLGVLDIVLARGMVVRVAEPLPPVTENTPVELPPPLQLTLIDLLPSELCVIVLVPDTNISWPPVGSFAPEA